MRRSDWLPAASRWCTDTRVQTKAKLKLTEGSVTRWTFKWTNGDLSLLPGVKAKWSSYEPNSKCSKTKPCSVSVWAACRVFLRARLLLSHRLSSCNNLNVQQPFGGADRDAPLFPPFTFCAGCHEIHNMCVCVCERHTGVCMLIMWFFGWRDAVYHPCQHTHTLVCHVCLTFASAAPNWSKSVSECWTFPKTPEDKRLFFIRFQSKQTNRRYLKFTTSC